MVGRTYDFLVQIGGKVAGSLGGAVGKAQRQMAAMQTRMQTAQLAREQRLGQSRAAIFDAAAFGGSLYAAVRPAIAFEDAMADIRKVVDFDKPTGLRDMEESILGLSRRIPIAATGLAEIVAAFGQGGVAAKDLLGYTEAAAQMSVAFGISAKDAGTSMAQIRSAFGASLPEIVQLNDAINQLGNNMAAAEKGILETVQRVGPAAKAAGVSAREVAAFASVMQSAGVRPESAGTAITSMLSRLSAGTKATKKQQDALKELKLDPAKIARGLSKDSGGTIRKVLEKLAALRPDKRSALGVEIFGLEHFDEVMALGSNLEEYGKAFGLIKREQDYAGATAREYANRLDTTSTAVQLLKNQVEGLAIRFGEGLTPGIRQATDVLGPYLDGIGAWMKGNPGTVSAIALTTAGLVGLKVALAGGGFLWNTLAMAATGAAGTLAGIGSAVAGLAAPMGVATAATGAFRMALIGTGIGAAVVALAAGGVWIYNNWSNLKAMAEGFGEGFMAALGPARPLAEAVGGALGGVVDWFTALTGPIEGAEADFRSFGESAGAAIGGAVAAVAGFVSGLANIGPLVTQALAGAATAVANFVSGMYASGQAMITSFVAGIESVGSSIADSVRGALGKARNLLPFSDAKEGPFSSLTRSGAAILPTMAEGVRAAGAASLAGALSAALAGASGGAAAAGPAAEGGSAGGAAVTINASFTINATPGTDTAGLQAAVEAALDAARRREGADHRSRLTD